MNVFGIIDREMTALGLRYEYFEWTQEIAYPYFVGEYSDTAGASEDGAKSGVIIISGTTRGKFIELEDARASIEEHFPQAGGYTAATDDGVVAIFYESSMPVPTGEADLKRVQINLTIKEWRTN